MTSFNSLYAFYIPHMLCYVPYEMFAEELLQIRAFVMHEPHAHMKIVYTHRCIQFKILNYCFEKGVHELMIWFYVTYIVDPAFILFSHCNLFQLHD